MLKSFFCTFKKNSHLYLLKTMKKLSLFSVLITFICIQLFAIVLMQYNFKRILFQKLYSHQVVKNNSNHKSVDNCHCWKQKVFSNAHMPMIKLDSDRLLYPFPPWTPANQMATIRCNSLNQVHICTCELHKFNSYTKVYNVAYFDPMVKT